MVLFFNTDININFLKVYCYINTLLDKHFCTNQTCNLMIKVYKTNMGTLSFSHIGTQLIPKAHIQKVSRYQHFHSIFGRYAIINSRNLLFYIYVLLENLCKILTSLLTEEFVIAHYW